MPSLRKIDSLERLNLQDTAVTEKGLIKLRGLKLQQLLLSDGKFSPGYRARLGVIFPGIRWVTVPDGFTVGDDIKLILESVGEK
jgi:hypothetical protein